MKKINRLKLLFLLICMPIILASCSVTGKLRNEYSFYRWDVLSRDIGYDEDVHSVTLNFSDTIYRVYDADLFNRFSTYVNNDKRRKKWVRKGYTLEMDCSSNADYCFLAVPNTRDIYIAGGTSSLLPPPEIEVYFSEGGSQPPGSLSQVLPLLVLRSQYSAMREKIQLFTTDPRDFFNKDKTVQFAIWSANDISRNPFAFLATSDHGTWSHPFRLQTSRHSVNAANTISDNFYISSGLILDERIPAGIFKPDNPCVELVFNGNKFGFYDLKDLFDRNSGYFKSVTINVSDRTSHLSLDNAIIELVYDDLAPWELYGVITDWISNMPDFGNVENPFYPSFLYSEYLPGRVLYGNVWQRKIGNGERFVFPYGINTEAGFFGIPVETVKIKITNEGYHFFEQEFSLQELLDSRGILNIYMTDIGIRIRIDDGSGTNYYKLN